MSETEPDDPDLPPAAECDRRCKEFAAITQTDTALAMFFLQDRGWNLEISLSDYYQSIDMERGEVNTASNPSSIFPINGVSKKILGDSQEKSKDFVDPEPHRIRIMSWNIDGLDQNNIKTRAKAACKNINSEKPDVVYLQEVVLKNLEVIKEKCSDYSILVGTERGYPRDNGEYFTAILLKKNTTEYLDHSVHPFSSSIMSRTLLQVEAKVKGISFWLMTSHLESTVSHEAERLKQLKFALETAYKVPKDKVVVFGGDLNVRDSEIQKIGGVKEGLVDIWEGTGRRPEAQYTWDMQKNDNIEMTSQRSKPRFRFDRLFYRGVDQVQAVYFELVGFHRDEECRRFPSDHWGIMAHFNKMSSSSMT